MEVDIIILPKDCSEQGLQLGMKKTIKNLFEKLYDDVQEESFRYDLEGERLNIKYQLSAKNVDMVFVKFECDYTPVKSAKALDCVVNKLIRGEHRKDWNIVITYDEVSQLYCCKLMPLLGVFERRTRELVYITVIKIFGVEWYEKSFSESLQNELKGKGNKTKLVESALNELTYEQLKEYLFVPFSSRNLSEVLECELAKEHMETLSKEEIENIIDKCRSFSLWDRFFGKYTKFKNFKDKIDELQPYRNTVMHNKRITQREYEKVRKSLKSVNVLLIEAINVLEEDMYTETKLVDVMAALGNLLSNILGDTIPRWIEKMKPALAAFGRIAIEAAMPQINIPDVMPSLNLGNDLSQRFEHVYNMPHVEVPNMDYMQGIQMQFLDDATMRTVNSLYDSSTVKLASELAETYGRISENLSSISLMEDNEEKKEVDISNCDDDTP